MASTSPALRRRYLAGRKGSRNETCLFLPRETRGLVWGDYPLRNGRKRPGGEPGSRFLKRYRDLAPQAKDRAIAQTARTCRCRALVREAKDLAKRLACGDSSPLCRTSGRTPSTLGSRPSAFGSSDIRLLPRATVVQSGRPVVVMLSCARNHPPAVIPLDIAC
jgi:hypothetical protein